MNIATTKEQSARLTACGVRPNSADMTLSYCDGDFYELMATPFHYGCFNEKDNPAWSLSALLSLLPQMIDGGYWLAIQKCQAKKDKPTYYGVAYFKCKWDNPKNAPNCTITTVGKKVYFTDRELIEAVVKMIEWLIANGYPIKAELSQKSAKICDNKNLISKSEPKFKLWDLVVYDGEVHKIVGILPCAQYHLSGHEYAVDESRLQPYTEPNQTNDNMEDKEHRNLSQDSVNCEKDL